jgi:hypothetical protein
MYVDTLRLTDVGLQAINDADNQGIHIRPVQVVAGDYQGVDPTTVPTALLGNELYRGPLAYVEVLSKNSCRFAFRIPQSIPVSDTVAQCVIGEFLVLLDDGRVFGHVTLAQPQLKVNTFGLQFSLLVVSNYAVGKVVDVQMADHSTIPCVSDIELMPAPVDSTYNAVVVFNAKTNSDLSTSPSLAYKYGQGGMEWGFSEHDRLFSGALGSRLLTASQIKFDDYSSDLTEGDSVIVQVLSGAATGAMRRFKYTQKTLVLDGSPIAAFDSGCYISVWRRNPTQANSQTSLTWPSNSDVPSSWVLSRGSNGSLVWSPPNSGSAASTVTGASLYVEPSQLVITPITTTATVSSKSYTLASVPETEADLYLALQGVSQARSSFFLTSDGIELSESVPSSMTLDARVFNHQPSTGHRTDMYVVDIIGDGVTSNYDLPALVTSASQVFAITNRILQPVTAYAVSNGQIQFTEPLPIGFPAVLYCFVSTAKLGYSTHLKQVSFLTNSSTTQFELPVTPESNAYVIFNEQGAILHPDSFAVVGNLVTTTNSIPKGRYIEITVIENIQSQGSNDNSLNGIVKYALPSPDGMTLIRHNAPPIRVPAPVVSIASGVGIRVDGVYPNLSVVNTQAEAASKDPMTGYSNHQRLTDTEEIIVTQRIKFVGDIMIQATADFTASLGPGFSVTSGNEQIQYMVAVIPVGATAPAYNRKIKGTDEAGFTVLDLTSTDCIARANATMSQIYNIAAANHPAKYVDVIAKMRVANAQVASYSSDLSCSFNIMVFPK